MNNEEIREKIKSLQEQKKEMGRYRASCANLGRGVTDSILRDMERIEDKIDIFREMITEEEE
jgi:hypothetical protein